MQPAWGFRAGGVSYEFAEGLKAREGRCHLSPPEDPGEEGSPRRTATRDPPRLRSRWAITSARW
jgi:hypothetical protein